MQETGGVGDEMMRNRFKDAIIFKGGPDHEVMVLVGCDDKIRIAAEDMAKKFAVELQVLSDDDARKRFGKRVFSRKELMLVGPKLPPSIYNRQNNQKRWKNR